MSRRTAATSPLRAGRQAFERRRWREALDLLSAADHAERLEAPDLERLGEAGEVVGEFDACVGARERAFAAYLEGGNRRRAAFIALKLADDFGQRMALSIAAGWVSQATRLLEAEAESAEHGYLAHRQCRVALVLNALDEALVQAERVLEIGLRFQDAELRALGLDDKGLVLVAMGRVTEGLALLDEAIVAAVAGDLSVTTAVIYCNLISTCRDLGDYRRAGEWTEAARRWREGQVIAGFPGLCRVYRAEVMRVRGAWGEAEKDAQDACAELEQVAPAKAAEAFYELGEIRLRLGDLPAAEQAFRRAHELGYEPQPGLSVLRMKEGDLEAAAAMINRALQGAVKPVVRSRLLPDQVEIAITKRDLALARSAAAELQTIAETHDTPALHGAAACALGAVHLAAGEVAAAIESLRAGVRHWLEADAPFEAARARMLLAAAFEAEGENELGRLELEAAHSTFQRLGAALETRRAAELLARGAGQGASDASTNKRRATKTFVFTDICKSTDLAEAMGDDAWEDIRRWQDTALRSLVAAHAGEVVNTWGDGFFIVFDDAAAAVECAVAFQRSLAGHRREHGFAPQVRIGIHTAEAIRRGGDYTGSAVNQASRIGALAEAGEILLSGATSEAAGPAFGLSEPREVKLKGVGRPVRVAAVLWR